MSAPNILIALSSYYAGIAAELRIGSEEKLNMAGASHKLLEVPGAFELPAAIGMAVRSGHYDGYLALGCVIRGETSHYDHICTEVTRALMELSMAGHPLGFGLLTCQSIEQAEQRASRNGKNHGAKAAAACLAMLELSQSVASPS